MTTEHPQGTELATVEGHGSALVVDAESSFWNEAQLAVLRQIGGNAERASQGDLQVFHHVCSRTGLDPFAGQVRLVGRQQKVWDPESRTETREWRFTIQTGIDGYRTLARRAADRADVDLEYGDTEWCDSAGNWTPVWTKATAPAGARVTVLRDGLRFPAVALYAEYVQTKGNGEPNQMWQKMPAGQLAKCAEALALRKAFPQDLSDVYADEEMAQADNPATIEGEVVPTPGRRERRRRDGLGDALARRSGPEEAPNDATARASEATDPSGPESPRIGPEHGDLIQRMQAKLAEIGVVPNSEGYSSHLAKVLGRPVASYADMTVADVEAVIANAEQSIDAPFPDDDGDGS
jgi:phage recombination protein Bet